MCGTVSFKRGDTFYRNSKISFTQYNANYCEATVSGSEEFLVTIKRTNDGGFRTECSCPKLASFQKECQHVAAVLLSIYDHQRRGTEPSTLTHSEKLTEDLLNLFDHQPVRSSARQLHFDNRKVLNVAFLCKPISVSKGYYMFGIHMKIGTENVKNIREFLQLVKQGTPYKFSTSFTFNPTHHCFRKETAAVVSQLIKVIQDEKIYVDSLPDQMNDAHSQEWLLIPPSSWEQLYPLLAHEPLVKVEYDGNL